jgi:asparagine synthase (glutamine-hydrolysing)
MCGIAGILSARPDPSLREASYAMAQSLVHRGPDGKGFWNDETDRIFFAHRRLSIIDLSDASHQPFVYGNYVLVFNGEIYNYRELKQELLQRGYVFSTTGDSEVIPAAWDYWGADCLHKFDGMFAFALLNTQSQKLVIARDRFGEKPLYFAAQFGSAAKLEYLAFASEMKALWAAGITREANHKMLINYLSLGYVQNPIVKTDTFFKNIQSLPPGYLLDADMQAMKFTMRRWYEPFKRIGHLAANQTADENTVIEQFLELFMQSVERRLRSDVPVGTSLSGGLDSSSIVASIDALKKKGNTTEGWANVCFSAIFPGFEKDENDWSKQVAEQFNISRYTVEPTEDDLLLHFNEMMFYQEEPVQSSSALAQYLVYKTAKDEAVSVLLDGQGADEILSGYSRYSHWYLQQLLRQNVKAMHAEKKLLAENGMLEQWGFVNYVSAWLPHQTATLLKRRAIKQQQQFPFNRDYFEANKDDNTLFKPLVRNLDDILYFNTFNFGLEELLRYSDRNSMAHSREVRLPFLQHDLVEFIFSLPAHFKIRQGFGKWILRKAMEPYLPANVVWRKGKVGFEPPQQQWIHHERMKSGIMESRNQLVAQKIIHPAELNRSIADKGAHDPGSTDWRYLCAVNMLGKI